MTFEMHERVRSITALDDIRRGTVGAIVHSLPNEEAPEAYLVEFFDGDGDSIDVVKVTPDQIERAPAA